VLTEIAVFLTEVVGFLTEVAVFSVVIYAMFYSYLYSLYVYTVLNIPAVYI
jgi:hypothetical protein